MKGDFSRQTCDPENQVMAVFGDIAQLTGYRLKPEEPQVVGDLELTLYWRATNRTPVAVDDTVFVHPLDRLGQLIAHHDREPATGRRSTRTWKEGDLIVDTHQLQWTGSHCSELYYVKKFVRLPARGPDGERMLDDRVALH